MNSSQMKEVIMKKKTLNKECIDCVFLNIIGKNLESYTQYYIEMQAVYVRQFS